jgi:hypothetical protein
MEFPFVRTAALGIFSILVLADSLRAQRFEFGLRGQILLADGEPANDLPGYGAFARYRFNERWSVGLAVDQTEYDFEQPARLLGLQQDPAVEPVDALAEATTFSLWLQRSYSRPGSRIVWFWGVGVGVVSVDVPDVSGPLASGGVFDVHTEVDSEIIASALGGLQWNLSRLLFLEFAGRVEQHFADWQITDRVSGATGTVEDYLTYGGHLGLGFRF